MRKLFRVLVEVTIDAFCNFAYFIKNNLTNFANILNLTLPYVMYFIGQYIAFNRNNISIGWEICTPIVFVVVIYYLRSTANKMGKGITIPIPDKRFTKVDDDGEVSIEHKRVQELLLYTADLEDWLERKGLL
jgi:hypothetical protein